MIHGSWFIELVRLSIKILACALKNKIKIKSLIDEPCTMIHGSLNF